MKEVNEEKTHPQLGKRIKRVLLPVVGRFIRHLTYEGVRDQLNKFFVEEGPLNYLTSRFGMPLRFLVSTVKEAMGFEARYIKKTDLGAFSFYSYEREIKTRKRRGAKTSTLEGVTPSVMVKLCLCPVDSELSYFIGDVDTIGIDFVKLTREYHQRNVEPHFLVVPPVYSANSFITETGVVKVDGKSRDVIMPLTEKMEQFRNFHGGIYMGNDGEVRILKYNELSEDRSWQKGYLIQGGYLLTNDNYREFIQLSPDFMNLNTIGVFEMPDGEVRIFAIDTLELANIWILSQLAEEVKRDIGADSWAMIGLENAGGGLLLNTKTDYKQALGDEGDASNIFGFSGEIRFFNDGQNGQIGLETIESRNSYLHKRKDCLVLSLPFDRTS